jgi:hypothetical protein
LAGIDPENIGFDWSTQQTVTHLPFLQQKTHTER